MRNWIFLFLAVPIFVLLAAWGGASLPDHVVWLENREFELAFSFRFDVVSRLWLTLLSLLVLCAEISAWFWSISEETRTRFFAILSAQLILLAGLMLAEHFYQIVFFDTGLGLISAVALRGGPSDREWKRVPRLLLWLWGGSFLVLFASITCTVQLHSDALEPRWSQETSWLSQAVGAAQNQAVGERLAAPHWNQNLPPTLAVSFFLLALALGVAAIGRFFLLCLVKNRATSARPVGFEVITSLGVIPAALYMLFRFYPYLALDSYVMIWGAIFSWFICFFVLLGSPWNDQANVQIARIALVQGSFLAFILFSGGVSSALVQAMVLLIALVLFSLVRTALDDATVQGWERRVVWTALILGAASLGGVPPLTGFFSRYWTFEFEETHFSYEFIRFVLGFLPLILIYSWSLRKKEQIEKITITRVVSFTRLAPLLLLTLILVFAGPLVFSMQTLVHEKLAHTLELSGQLSDRFQSARVKISWGSALEKFGFDCTFVVLFVFASTYFPKLPRQVALKKISYQLQTFWQERSRRMVAMVEWMDGWFLEGLSLRGVGVVLTVLGEALRLFQTGSLRGYVVFFLIMALALIYYFAQL